VNKYVKLVFVMENAVGRICISKAGHDKGAYYTIVSVIDDKHVGVADGKIRFIGKPKKKNLRHLFIMNSAISEIERLLAGESVGSNLKLVAILDAIKRGVSG